MYLGTLEDETVTHPPKADVAGSRAKTGGSSMS